MFIDNKNIFTINDLKKKYGYMIPDELNGIDLPEIFNGRYIIGVDTNDVDMCNNNGLSLCSKYDKYDLETKNNFDKELKAGRRHNPTLKLFDSENPSKVFSTGINIWSNVRADDYWYRMVIRPNRIYFTDYDGFKIYDFELNVIYFKKAENNNCIGFCVNNDNTNSFWIWNISEAKKILNYQPRETLKPNRDPYECMVGIETICENIVIH